MPDIYSGANDGWILKSDSTFAGARDATTGTSSNSSASSNNFAIRASFAPGRPSGTYYMTRSFFYFDTSSVSDIPVEATLKIYGVTNMAADFRVVKSTQLVGLGLATSDFDSIVGWATGTDNSSRVTYYDTAETSAWSIPGYIDVTLSDQALVDMVAYDTFKCCLIEADHDLSNSSSLMNATNYSGLYYANESDSAKRPYIQYTAGESNAIFFGANF